MAPIRRIPLIPSISMLAMTTSVLSPHLSMYVINAATLPKPRTHISSALA